MMHTEQKQTPFNEPFPISSMLWRSVLFLSLLLLLFYLGIYWPA